jgi:hypothetical protein
METKEEYYIIQVEKAGSVPGWIGLSAIRNKKRALEVYNKVAVTYIGRTVKLIKKVITESVEVISEIKVA